MLLHRITIAIFILNNFLIVAHAHGSKCQRLTCGKRLVNPEALIVNGHKSRDGDWPWHTSILHVELDQNIQYKCGGTLLNSNSILTAAHCVYENGRPIVPDRILIQLGRPNLKVSATYSQEIQAYRTYVHEDFNATSLRNDIAIIRLATEVTFNNYIQPICLWDSNKKDLSEVVGKFGTAVGFGITEKNKVSTNLREAVMPVVSLTTCLDSGSSFYGSVLSDSTFCAGFRNGTTVCNGDSGGSLTFEENGVYRIRGIVSLTQARPDNQNRFCKTDEYVVFTDVAKYLDWIRQLVSSLPSPPTGSLIGEDLKKHCRYADAVENEYKDFFKITGLKGARPDGFIAHFPFYVKAQRDAHVLLTMGSWANREDNEYEIVIGGWSGTQTVIRRKQQSQEPLAKVQHGEIISSNKWTEYLLQITRDDGIIKLYRKDDEDSYKLIIVAIDLTPIPVEYISFGSWGSNHVEFFFDCSFNTVSPDAVSDKIC